MVSNSVLSSAIIGSTWINGIAPNISSFVRAGARATELFALIDRTSDINPLSESGQKPSKVSGVIEIQSIGFSYATRPDTKVFDDFFSYYSGWKSHRFSGMSFLRSKPL